MKNTNDVKWKEIIILWIIVIALFALLWSCAGDNDKCKTCNGSGYYQKKTCVFCKGTGKSDINPYK